MPAWLLPETGIKRKEAERILTDRGGTADGHFIVRELGGRHVLTVIFEGRPTHHKIEAGPDGHLKVNGVQYGPPQTSLNSVIKQLMGECDGWPIKLVSIPQKSEASVAAAAPDDDDPFGTSDDPIFGGGGSAVSTKKKRPKRNKKPKGSIRGAIPEAIPEEGSAADNNAVDTTREASPSGDGSNSLLKVSKQFSVDNAQRQTEELEAETQGGTAAASALDFGLDFPGDESSIEADAAAAAKKARLQREKVKSAEAEKKAVAAEMDSVFGDDRPKPKQAGNGKPLSGWRLKKALRKAASEAEAKEIPVETYITENYPELVEHMGSLPTPAQSKGGAGNVPAKGESSKKIDDVRSKEKAAETEKASVTKTAKARAMKAREAEKAKEEANKAEEQAKQAKKEAAAKAKKDAPKVVEKAKEATPRKPAKKVKEAGKEESHGAAMGREANDKPSKASTDATETTAAAAADGVLDVAPTFERNDASHLVYAWEEPGSGRAQRIEARQLELIKLGYNDHDDLRTEWTRLILARNAAGNEATDAEIEANDAVGRGSTESEKPSSTSASQKESNQASVSSAKKSSWLGGWFASKPTEDPEEDVPDHDLDENGNPLSRLELLRRQSKRQRQQKRRAARAAQRAHEEAPSALPGESALKGSSEVSADKHSGSIDGGSLPAENADDEDLKATQNPTKYGDTSDSESDDDEVSARKDVHHPVQSPLDRDKGADDNDDGGGAKAIDSRFAQMLLEAIAELRGDRDCLRSEVSNLRRELGQVKAELGRMKVGTAVGGRAMPTTVSAVYAWYESEPASPRKYYLKLTDRRAELQDRARSGIQDPTQKELWSTEWEALKSELDAVGLKMNQGGLQEDHVVEHASTVGSPETLSGIGEPGQSIHTIVAFGGRVGTLDAVGYVERFDIEQKVWVPLAPLPTVRFGLACSTLHGYGYVVGGSAASGSSLNTVERYDVATNRWENVATCSTTRAGLATAVLGDHLYAVGGASDQLFGSVVLSSAERYNPQKDTWRNITPMHKKRAGLALVTFDGSLYAIGGYDQSVKPHSQVERYDEQTNSWSLIASMNAPRARLAAVVCDGYIYAIGGFDGSKRLASVERYDPKTRRWHMVASMSKPRDYLTAAAVGSHLYSIGGYDGSSRLGLVERYDSTTDTWSEDQQLCFPRDGLAASSLSVVLRRPVDDGAPAGVTQEGCHPEESENHLFKGVPPVDVDSEEERMGHTDV